MHFIIIVVLNVSTRFLPFSIKRTRVLTFLFFDTLRQTAKPEEQIIHTVTCDLSLEVDKILRGIYDRDISGGILELAQDSNTRGHSLKLVAQHFKIETSQSCQTVEFINRICCCVIY